MVGIARVELLHRQGVPSASRGLAPKIEISVLAYSSTLSGYSAALCADASSFPVR